MTNDVNSLIEDNINIAYNLSWQYYNKFDRKIELDELQSLSFLGLTKAAKTFKPELTYNFSTYAYKCIMNEILLYHRNNKKHIYTSLSEEIGENIYLEDVIDANVNVEEDIFKNLEIVQLYKFIDELTDLERNVILYRLKGYTMDKIGKKLNYSQPHISKVYNKALNKLRYKFRV